MTQPELFPARKLPVRGSKAARLMIAVMVKRPGWLNRRDFSRHGLTPESCKAGCRAAHGRILFGQKGYILMRDATYAEIDRCLATITSRITALQGFHRDISRRKHSSANWRVTLCTK